MVYALNYLKRFKAVPKTNPWTPSPQQNKKTLLTTAAHVKVSTPIRLQRQ